MDFISQPFALLLRAFYSFTKNYAVALIFFTLVVKLVFSFVNVLQQRSAQSQARIRPKVNAIRNRYIGRTDSHVQIEFQNDIQNLYKQEKASQSLGCLPLLIQLLIVMVLYQIIYNPLTYIAQFEASDFKAIKEIIVTNFDSLELSKSLKTSISKSIADSGTDIAKQVKNLQLSEMEYIDILSKNKALFPEFAKRIPDFTIFGGKLDLAQKPTFGSLLVLIPILTAVFQLASVFIIQLFAPKPDTSTAEAQQAQKTMLITNVLMTLVSAYIAFSFPAIIGVYWIYQSIVGTVISVVLHKVMPIPTYTADEMAAIEAEYNKDYVRPEIPQFTSLHYIDDDDCEGDFGEDDVQDEDEDAMPKRRMYDKDGNKIHSLHFIDDEDEDDLGDEDTNNDA